MKKIITVFTICIIGIQYTIAGNIDSIQSFTLQHNHNYLKANSAFSVNKVTNHYPKKLMQSIEVLLLTSSLVTYGLSEYYNQKYNDDKLVKYQNKSEDFLQYSKILAVSTAGTFILDILLRKVAQRNDRIKFRFAYDQPYKFSNIKTTTLSLTYTL